MPEQEKEKRKSVHIRNVSNGFIVIIENEEQFNAPVNAYEQQETFVFRSLQDAIIKMREIFD